MDDWLSWPGWLTIADSSPTYVVTLQLQIEHKTGKVRRPETDVLLLPLLSARPVGTFPAKEHHCLSTSTSLYCSVTEAHSCEQLAQGCHAVFSWWELNPRPIDLKSNALLLRHFATFDLV